MEAQEALLALLLEPHGRLIDDLGDQMAIDEDDFKVDGHQSIGELRKRLYSHFAWALGTDYQQPEQCARFWYVSEEKLEPRLGERHSEPGAECEQPLDIGRQVAELYNLLKEWSDWNSSGSPTVGTSRVSFHCPSGSTLCSLSFAEIQDNLISAEMLPIDLLRSKLAFLEQLALILVLIAGFESACFRRTLPR